MCRVTHHADVSLRINGADHALSIDTRTPLLVDGRRANACLLLAVAVEGSEVTTVEGLADGDGLHPLQSAFIEHDAFQCGYCTPGQLCSALGLLKEGNARSPEAIRELMSGNLCPCGA